MSRHAIALGFALAALALALNTFISYGNLRSLAAEGRRVNDVHVVRARFFSLLSTVNDAETGQRGYLITSLPDYLAPYESARQRLPQELENLREATAADDTLRASTLRLEALTQSRMAEMDKILELHARSSPEAARARLMEGRGKAFMDQIRKIVREIDEETRPTLLAREAELEQLRRTAILSTVFGAVLGIGMVGAAVLLVQRELASRRAAESEARDVEGRFRLLTDAIPQFVWTTRPDGYVDYLNQRWYDYTGLKPADSLGLDRFIPMHPEDAAAAQEGWQHALVTKDPFEMEYRLRGQDGQYRWFLVRAQPHRDAEGRVLRWLGTATDVDDQRRHAELLEAMVQKRTSQLERSNKELEEFASIASHDLQEPLRKIQAFGDRLAAKYRGVLGSPGDDYLDRMLTSATRMRRLINDLLTFSRVSRKAQPPTWTELGPLVAEVVGDLESRLADCQGTITVGALPALEADPSQMRQLFQNLLGNALKFQRPGVPPEVRVEGRTFYGSEEKHLTGNRPYCLISVHDNGIGFEETYSERIFQVFQRLHGRHEYEGTGIGLAVCRKIVERHGGHLTARSTLGVGSTFMVVLPIRQPQEVDVVAN